MYVLCLAGTNRYLAGKKGDMSMPAYDRETTSILEDAATYKTKDRAREQMRYWRNRRNRNGFGFPDFVEMEIELREVFITIGDVVIDDEED